MRDLIEQLQAETAGLVALQRRAERLVDEVAEGRSALVRYDAELAHARLTSEQDRETIEGLRADLDRREALVAAFRRELASILEAT